ncbi:serine hydrolase domain-containing protein [Thermaurantiacus sp.]
MIGRLVAALIAAAPALAQPPADEAAFIAERAKALPVERGVEAVEAYQPSERVRGGRGRALPAIVPEAAGLCADALAAAAAWAEARQSHALLIARDGRLVFERYWNGFGRDSRFSTASMMKAVVALAFGPAIAEGRIALDDPVGRHLSEWRQDPRGSVTLRQLLHMESGLAFPPAPPGPPSPASPALRLMFAPDIRAVALAVPQAVPPGNRFAYSNVDSQLAGEALAASLGRLRFAEFLSQRIWKPMGAADAELFLDRVGGSPHYFCCLQARPMDWLRLGELIRNRGRAGGRQLVPEAHVAAMLAPAPTNPNFGMQIWRGSPHAPVRRYGPAIALTVPAAEPFLRDDVVFIDGAGGQRVYVIPSARMTIVRIGRPAPDWDDSALVNLVLRGLS